MSEVRYRKLADRLLNAASAAGADDAEVMIDDSDAVAVTAFGGKVESFVSAHVRGVGLRVRHGERFGFAHSNDLRAAGLRRVVQLAIDSADNAMPDPDQRFAEPQTYENVPGLVTDRPEPTNAERIKLVTTTDRAVVRRHPEVRSAQSTGYGDGRSHTELFSTRGVAAAQESTNAALGTTVIAARGEEQRAGGSSTVGRHISDLDPEEVISDAIARAASALGATSVSSRECEVIFDPYVTAQLLAFVAGGLDAEAVQYGESIFGDSLGTAIAAPRVTLIDDGRKPGGRNSGPWDGEGTPTQRTPLIEDGVVHSYLHTIKSASHVGALPTGTATRSYQSTPSASASNLILAPGSTSSDQLLRRVGNGILVTEVQGLNTIRGVSGEFSVGISGFLIENGAIGRPIARMTVAGRFQDLLHNVEAIGSDVTHTPGGTESASLLVSGLTVAGEGSTLS